MPPLRIVHAVPFFHPATGFGGPVTQLRVVARGLAERGHVVRVVTTELGVHGGLPRERWIEQDGYQIWYGRVGRLGRFAPYYAPRLRRPLDEALDGADVLHLALSFTHLNVIARRAARAAGVPYVYTPRSCLDPVRLRQRWLLKQAFLALFERTLVADAAAVHALTATEREQVMGQGARAEQIRIIPNAAELAEHDAWPDGALFRERFGLAPAAPIVLFMGRLHRVKGLELLVEAFAAARRRVPAAQLVIAGPAEGAIDSTRRAVRRLGLDDAVTFVGTVTGDLRLAALRAADVFALTSYSEGMPNAVLEACAAGTPVLVTDRCNLPEVAAWNAGRVEPPDAARLGAALADMLDSDRRAEMGARGQAMVRDHFRAHAVLDRIEALYAPLARPEAA